MLNISGSSRKVDKNLFNNTAEDFIPIACHYDKDTLLTKNGELIQTLQINGINSEKISNKLFNLREMVRNAIKKNVNSGNFAFWIHTVRRKTNLDDTTLYNKLLPANIHSLWQRKNYWDDKFVNTLYISIIHDSASIKVRNLNSLVNSLSFKVIADFHDKYLENALKELNDATNRILLDLEEFGAVKLGIRFEGEKSFSDPMFLYRSIVHLKEEECLVPITNLSYALASTQYAVGSDKIQIISREDKKFASILSIKEYQEVSSSSLDGFLQLPVELIATEIFTFISKNEVNQAFESQDYLANVSGDDRVREVKGINKILKLAPTIPTQFCKQQLFITITASNIDKLENDITQASKGLSKVGIVHVREDINLEQTFWSQLPGNFTFLRRMSPTILENVSALASLHNFPTGNQYNSWGKAVTLLRTQVGTPYFMNFHANNKRGNTCIFGTSKTGKTVLTNFLISEATKYNPTIVYLSNCNDAQLFIETLEGTWQEKGLEKDQNLFNPFLLEDTVESKKFVLDFLKILCNHYFSPLTEIEIAFLNNIISKIFELELSKRKFSLVLKEMDFSTEGGESIKTKLNDFTEGGLYYGVFEADKLLLSEGKIIGFNLYNFTEKYFTDRFYPKEKKYVNQFDINLTIHNSFSAAAIYAFGYHLSLTSSKPKIFVLDNLEYLCKPEKLAPVLSMISEKLAQTNGIMLSNFNFSYLQTVKERNLQEWLSIIDTKIILGSDVKIDYLDKLLGLTKEEIFKLSKFSIPSRMFLINQNDQSIAAELSIAGLIWVARLLSAKPKELEIYHETIQKYPGHPDNWMPHLINALSNI